MNFTRREFLALTLGAQLALAFPAIPAPTWAERREWALVESEAAFQLEMVEFAAAGSDRGRSKSSWPICATKGITCPRRFDGGVLLRPIGPLTCDGEMWLYQYRPMPEENV